MSATVALMGMHVHPVSPDEAVDRVTGSAGGGRLLTPNLQHLREFTRSAEVKSAFARCELVVPDGVPLLWASRVQGTPLPARVAGSDLIWPLTEAAARRSLSIFLLGGSPGTADAAARLLAERLPSLRIAGTHCPPMGFQRSPADMRALEATVTGATPDLVYIGLPLSKQLLVMETLFPRMPGSWFVGLGASFSFLTGDIRRAPVFLQRLGLEWLHRLAQEPRRLGRRYLVEGLPFFLHLMAAAWCQRLTDAI